LLDQGIKRAKQTLDPAVLPRGVVQDANGGMGALMFVGAKAQVHGPGVVDCNNAGLGGSDLAAQIGLGHVRFEV
jgi:hypothetical protein